MRKVPDQVQQQFGRRRSWGRGHPLRDRRLGQRPLRHDVSLQSKPFDGKTRFRCSLGPGRPEPLWHDPQEDPHVQEIADVLRNKVTTIFFLLVCRTDSQKKNLSRNAQNYVNFQHNSENVRPLRNKNKKGQGENSLLRYVKTTFWHCHYFRLRWLNNPSCDWQNVLFTSTFYK